MCGTFAKPCRCVNALDAVSHPPTVGGHAEEGLASHPRDSNRDLPVRHTRDAMTGALDTSFGGQPVVMTTLCLVVARSTVESIHSSREDRELVRGIA